MSLKFHDIKNGCHNDAIKCYYNLPRIAHCHHDKQHHNSNHLLLPSRCDSNDNHTKPCNNANSAILASSLSLSHDDSWWTRLWDYSESYYYYYCDTTSPSTKLMTLLMVGGSCYGSYKVMKWIQLYGWYGAIQYIWEGSPHSPKYQEYDTRCSSVEKKLSKIHNTLQIFEETLQRAQLNAIDDHNNTNNGNNNYNNTDTKRHETNNTITDTKMVYELWKQYCISHNIRDIQQRIAFLNHDIDMVASKVDEILSSHEDFYHINEYNTIRTRKKKLSSQIVNYMKRIDHIVSSYSQYATTATATTSNETTS